MNKRERALLARPIRIVIESDKDAWSSLKYQIEHGLEAMDFPYYPAALEFTDAARAVIRALTEEEKGDLIAEWRRVPRDAEPMSDVEILSRYAAVILDEVVTRARMAAARTVNW